MMNYEKLTYISSKIRSKLWNVFFSHNFKEFGRKTRLVNPLKIQGAEYIKLGNGVLIDNNAWLLALKINKKIVPCLSISDGTSIGNFAHIVCVRNVKIAKHAMIADKVYISDNLHCYDNIKLPIRYQPVKYKADVKIGNGAWIGEGVSIIGASVGINSIIGANSVVTKDIPDYCVAIGSPARVIKKYNFHRKEWVKT